MEIFIRRDAITGRVKSFKYVANTFIEEKSLSCMSEGLTAGELNLQIRCKGNLLSYLSIGNVRRVDHE